MVEQGNQSGSERSNQSMGDYEHRSYFGDGSVNQSREGAPTEKPSHNFEYDVPTPDLTESTSSAEVDSEFRQIPEGAQIEDVRHQIANGPAKAVDRASLLELVHNELATVGAVVSNPKINLEDSGITHRVLLGINTAVEKL